MHACRISVSIIQKVFSSVECISLYLKTIPQNSADFYLKKKVQIPFGIVDMLYLNKNRKK